MLNCLSLDSFYLTEEHLENSPSRQDGIDKDTETSLRMYGCELIQEAGMLLGFPQVVQATGQVLLHRFYCKRSMKNFNVKKVAATALWVAAKLEEVKEVRDHPRKLIEMVMVAVDRCITRRDSTPDRKLTVLDSHSKEGEEFRRSLIRYEAEMLRAFGFIMNVEHPHRLLVNFLQVIFMHIIEAHNTEREDAEAFEAVRHLIQEAWNHANDSLRTTLCVRFKGSVVACGIIFYTSRRLKVPLPADWWELFMVKLEDMCEVCRVLHELYLAPKPSFVPVCHQLLPSKPPTPAIGAAGAAAKGAVTATPTPMLGATPELNTRPGDKRLDPSVRRTIPASESTPNLATAGAVAGAAGAAAANGSSAVPSPEGGAAAPGSARKRSRSRSPLPPAADSRKRLQLDSKKPGLPPLGPSQLSKDQQLQQQAREAVAAAEAAAAATTLQRPRSAGGDRERERDSSRDREYGSSSSGVRRGDRGPDRGSDRGSRRDRPRSRSRDRKRSRSRSRDRRRGSSRDRSRRSRSRSRSRDRRRGSSRDRKRSRSRSRDRRRSRSRSRDRRRERDSRPDGRNRDAGRQLSSPNKPDKQPPQKQGPAGSFPPPPAASLRSPAKAAAAKQPAPAAATAASDGSKENHKQQPSSTANGVRSPQTGEQVDKGAAAAQAQPADAAAEASKAKPKAVRKAQQSADAAPSPASNDNTAAAAPPDAAQQGNAD